MNLIEEFKKGQLGSNKGLPMGDGLLNISKAVNGIQKGRIYGFAGGPKSGKSTIVDYGFVIQPYMYCSKNNIPLEIIYYSFEIDRVSKEFDFATYFLYHDFGIETVQLEEGETYTVAGKIKTVIDLSPDYLRGRLQDDTGKIIKVKDSIKECLIKVYETRIIPLFGEYNTNGIQIKKGYIKFCSSQDNPTGVYKQLIAHAEKRGEFIKDPVNTKRLIAYKANNDKLYTIIVLDHLRKLIPEQGFQMKQTVDKMLEYMVIIRNLCNYTFVPIIHTNRNLADIETLRYAKDELYPTSETIKDSGNVSEDCNYLFTIFNPNDEKYRLTKHFGLDIKDSRGNPLYLNMRTVHLVESRHCMYPQHFRTEMLGNLKTFKQLNIKK